MALDDNLGSSNIRRNSIGKYIVIPALSVPMYFGIGCGGDDDNGIVDPVNPIDNMTLAPGENSTSEYPLGTVRFRNGSLIVDPSNGDGNGNGNGNGDPYPTSFDLDGLESSIRSPGSVHVPLPDADGIDEVVVEYESGSVKGEKTYSAVETGPDGNYVVLEDERLNGQEVRVSAVVRGEKDGEPYEMESDEEVVQVAMQYLNVELGESMKRGPEKWAGDNKTHEDFYAMEFDMGELTQDRYQVFVEFTPRGGYYRGQMNNITFGGDPPEGGIPEPYFSDGNRVIQPIGIKSKHFIGNGRNTLYLDEPFGVPNTSLKRVIVTNNSLLKVN